MSANRIEFESTTARELARIRRERGGSRPTGPGAYVSSDGETLAVRGSGEGPYSVIVGRASETGGSAAPLGTGGERGNAVQTGVGQRVLTDEWGRIWARMYGSPIEQTPIVTPTPGAGGALQQSAPIAPAAGETMRVLWGGVVIAGGAGVGYVLMFFDAAAPVINGASPLWREPILDAGVNFFDGVDVEFPAGGIPVTDGLVLALSTTQDVLTLGPTGFFQTIHTLT